LLVREAAVNGIERKLDIVGRIVVLYCRIILFWNIMKRILLLLLFQSLSFYMFGQKNVLFISVDDLKPMLGAYGNSQIQTPNIDRIAARGTTFLNTSCQISLCSPSRASVLSGLYPDASGIWDNEKNFRDVNPVLVTLPQYFKRKGYLTTGAGKIFHPTTIDGLGDEVSWSEQFVKTVGKSFYDKTTGKPYNHFHNPQVRADDIAYQQYLLDNNITDVAGKGAAYSLFPFANPSTESWDVPDDAYEDGAMANYVIKQLEELAVGATPFFLAVGFKKPHLPFVAPKKYWDLYDRGAISPDPNQERQAGVPAYAWKENRLTSGFFSDIEHNGAFTDEKQKELIHGYMACVSYSDALIGKLLDKLEEMGLSDNTIIVLWGDHGWHLGDHALWEKQTNFEQAVMSPLIIADPEIGTAGSVSESPAELIDIFPTLLELTGLEIPVELQGKSLVPVLEDPTAKVREANLSQFPRDDNGQPVMGYTLRNEQYRYTKWVHMDYENGERFGPAVGFQLYDLDADPHETNNLIGDAAYDEVVAYFEELFIERNIAQSTASSYLEVESCNLYEAPDGQTYTEEGLYKATVESSNGQDSVVNIRLSKGDFTLPDTEESLTICAGESYQFGTQLLTTAGSYEELFTSQLGCDSTVVLTLTLNPVYEEEITATICAGESYQFGTQLLTATGSYEELFTGQLGCDSTVVLTLTVNPIYEEETIVKICEGESYQFGTQLLTAAGSYEELFASQLGCDSLAKLNLIMAVVDRSVTMGINTLQAGEPDAAYQWYRCSGELIEGAESHEFTPVENGDYRVLIRKGGCEVESECIDFSLPLGLADASGELQVELFPNPVREGELFIRLKEWPGEVRIQLLDLTGRQVLLASSAHETTIAMDLNIPPGIYIVVVESDDLKRFSGRLIVE